ncbi:hypothetical protein WN48_04677 [Eufriesea mexicana]|uniref:Uncharacterized protein n=1 Tax=Eufriesea mexicana TaxID=516756 RepID=A0A310SSY8_9HYME|nr:hypothetical protein WN48_04677 [Eufriesea mexicana]
MMTGAQSTAKGTPFSSSSSPNGEPVGFRLEEASSRFISGSEADNAELRKCSRAQGRARDTVERFRERCRALVIGSLHGAAAVSLLLAYGNETRVHGNYRGGKLDLGKNVRSGNLMDGDLSPATRFKRLAPGTKREINRPLAVMICSPPEGVHSWLMLPACSVCGGVKRGRKEKEEGMRFVLGLLIKLGTNYYGEGENDSAIFLSTVVYLLPRKEAYYFGTEVYPGSKKLRQ